MGTRSRLLPYALAILSVGGFCYNRESPSSPPTNNEQYMPKTIQFVDRNLTPQGLNLYFQGKDQQITLFDHGNDGKFRSQYDRLVVVQGDNIALAPADSLLRSQQEFLETIIANYHNKT